jgi:hypothetical protein
MKELFIEVCMVRRSQFVIINFLQGKVVCYTLRAVGFSYATVYVFLHAFPSRLLGPCLLCVEKMLSFGCVCSMKMGLLKRVSPVLSDKNSKFFYLMTEYSPFNEYSVS